jgi:hypothetical protein
MAFIVKSPSQTSPDVIRSYVWNYAWCASTPVVKRNSLEAFTILGQNLMLRRYPSGLGTFCMTFHISLPCRQDRKYNKKEEG